MGQTNYSVGHEAEKRAAEYLQKLGYTIRDMNWKNRFCEIDIVAKKDKTLYFVEVKYRKNYQQGAGLDYITPKKLRQMEFAAQMWIQNHRWNYSYTLSAIEMTGEHFSVLNFIETIA